MKPGFQLAQSQAEAYEIQSGIFMRPSARLLVESLRLQAGDVVLDLACGTGLVAGYAFPMVQPDGRVSGADVNPAMLTVAESLSGPQIEWVEASAQNMPFDDAVFTHVICQQGFQFFPDAQAAANEAHRVLRPGGALAATIWATPGRNPYVETQLSMLAQLDDKIAASSSAATPTAAGDVLTRLATGAGFRDIGVSLLEHSVKVAKLGEFFLKQTATTPWAPVIARLTQPEQKRLAEKFVALLDQCAVSDGHLLPFCSQLLLCHK